MSSETSVYGLVMRVENRTGKLSGEVDTEVEDGVSEMNDRVDWGADEVVKLELALAFELVLEFVLALKLVLVDPLLSVVSESFVVSDLLSDVDVAESLVDEVAACESLELEGVMTVMVTIPEAELSVARSEPINSAIDVLIGYSIDKLLLLSNDDDDDDAELVVTLESTESDAELVDEEVVDASVDDNIDNGELLVGLEVCVVLWNFDESRVSVEVSRALDVKDEDKVVELLKLEVVKPPNQAFKLEVADEELDKLTVVDVDVTRESVVEGATSKLLEWSSVDDAIVDAELLLVDETGENNQSAEVDDSSVLEVLVLEVLDAGVLDWVADVDVIDPVEVAVVVVMAMLELELVPSVEGRVVDSNLAGN
ncbi:hypothetical protein GGI19_004805 [Coemansia pectinata]|uniref:Uncharacterized protein n=1 Tax=Coemansia pectinata TaxID=1052879 RepID=A0A9W8GVI1_9FUNG|nr:hypothetical protein GGI19_004805 [Coemansia pectinata]